MREMQPSSHLVKSICSPGDILISDIDCTVPDNEDRRPIMLQVPKDTVSLKACLSSIDNRFRHDLRRSCAGISPLSPTLR